MNTTEIISALDSEISRLRHVRELLSSLGDSSPSRGKLPSALQRQVASAEAEVLPKRGRGRPKGSTNKSTAAASGRGASKRRTMSAEGRERIAAAQRARWAKRNGSAAATKSAASKSTATKAEGRTSSAKKEIPPAARRKVGRPRKVVSAPVASNAAAKRPTKTEKRSTAGQAAKTAKKIPAKKTPAKQGGSGAETAASRATETNATA